MMENGLRKKMKERHDKREGDPKGGRWIVSVVPSITMAVKSTKKERKMGRESSEELLVCWRDFFLEQLHEVKEVDRRGKRDD